MFRGSTTIEMLEAVIRDGLAGDLAVVSSFGAESAVLLHLIASVDRHVPVLFLDTGYHFVETIGTRDAVAATLDVNLLTITPKQTVAEQDAQYGKDKGEVAGGLHGDVATASITVNSIPKILRVAPGLRTMADMPIPSWFGGK